MKGNIMAKSTIKLTIRKRSRSPKYRTLLGYNKLDNGWRVDVPYASVSCFSGSVTNPTRRNKASGLRFIIENNRIKSTRITHNVA